jgi:hypothetical protein
MITATSKYTVVFGSATELVLCAVLDLLVLVLCLVVMIVPCMHAYKSS